jgi:hypothetical protein
MVDGSPSEQAAATMRRINQVWLDGRVQDLEPLAHPDIVTVIPGFGQRIQGREGFLAGFRDFCENATIEEFREHDLQVDGTGNTSVVTFRYDMVFERSGQRYRCAGRDLWVLQKQDGAWIAVWRAMLDMEENPA